MKDKLCPLKIELINDRYYCIEDDCAWYVISYGEGICAIAQLANQINCEVKIHD